MFSILVVALLLLAHGAFYIVFAFVEPPLAVRRFFNIPSIFMFFPDHYQVLAGRISTGALLIVGGFIIAVEVLL